MIEVIRGIMPGTILIIIVMYLLGFLSDQKWGPVEKCYVEMQKRTDNYMSAERTWLYCQEKVKNRYDH